MISRTNTRCFGCNKMRQCTATGEYTYEGSCHKIYVCQWCSGAMTRQKEKAK